MKITLIMLATAVALSTGLAIPSGAGANEAARGGPSSQRLYSPHHMTPGVTSTGGTTGMGRGVTGGVYRDNDPNVYRDGQPRDDVNPHGG